MNQLIIQTYNMPNYLNKLGKSYSEEEVKVAAEKNGLEFNDFIGKFELELDEEFEVKGGLWETGKQYIESITSGYETGRTVEENLEVFKGSTSLDDIEAMIKAGDALNNLPQNDRMKRFQKKLKIMVVGFSQLYGL